jgi:hypothetical protein
MLSSDKNVETFAQLIETLKHYLGLQAEYVKLDVIDKVVRLITAAALTIVFCFLLVIIVLFASFAFAFWLSSYVGMGWSFLIVTIFHLIVFFVIISKRKVWIEKPLVRFLAEVFLGK